MDRPKDERLIRREFRTWCLNLFANQARNRAPGKPDPPLSRPIHVAPDKAVSVFLKKKPECHDYRSALVDEANRLCHRELVLSQEHWEQELAKHEHMA